MKLMKIKFGKKDYYDECLATEDWHKWFAWFPVKVGCQDYRWLEFVNRRSLYHMGESGDWYVFEYLSLEKKAMTDAQMEKHLSKGLD